MALLPAVLPAGPDASQQINKAVAGYLSKELRQEAARQGWQGMSFSHNTSLPADASSLPACAAPLQLRVSGSAGSLLGRQRFEINCPGPAGWSVTVHSQANVFLPVVHAQSIIERGQTIGRDDLKLERINIGKARSGFFHRLDDVAGLAAKRRIRANQTLTPALLTQPLAVRRGEPVKIIASHGSIEASTAGEALGDGQAGDLIRVRNLSSEKIIDARVLEPGVVTSTF